jgi:hypothetical protein
MTPSCRSLSLFWAGKIPGIRNAVGFHANPHYEPLFRDFVQGLNDRGQVYEKGCGRYPEPHEIFY